MKYIIFDLDATLLNNASKVTAYTLAVLKRLQAMGHKTVINTARSKSFSQEFFDVLKPDYGIYNGGAHIENSKEETIFKAELNSDETRQVIQDLLKVTQDISVQAENGMYSNKGLYTGQNSVAMDFEQEVFPYPAMKILAKVEDGEVAQQIAQKYDLTFTTLLTGFLRRYNKKGVDKAFGNRMLMELVGGNLSDVLAFGDDLGDVGMLREAGIGVLMKNAREELREEGLFVSAFTNQEDGVAKFLAEYFDL